MARTVKPLLMFSGRAEEAMTLWLNDRIGLSWQLNLP
jgi:predicted 3-demethylubiquinone-9 3-methyltransferase (glyoxalase superfamily)